MNHLNPPPLLPPLPGRDIPRSHLVPAMAWSFLALAGAGVLCGLLLWALYVLIPIELYFKLLDQPQMPGFVKMILRHLAWIALVMTLLNGAMLLASTGMLRLKPWGRISMIACLWANVMLFALAWYWLAGAGTSTGPGFEDPDLERMMRTVGAMWIFMVHISCSTTIVGCLWVIRKLMKKEVKEQFVG